MSFTTLGLMPQLLDAIRSSDYTTPTPIQAQAIPLILDGDDLLAASQTGTGKTAGFMLPLLQRLMRAHAGKSPHVRALILAPTRELAIQVEESCRTYGKTLPLRSIAIYGGVNINQQIIALRRGVDIIVATPGRLMDLIGQRALTLEAIEILVLDEADRMLDMGFIHDIRRILTLLPKKRQNLLFSATFSPEITTLAKGLLNDPKIIQTTRQNSTAEAVSQVVYPVDSKRKRELLEHLISSQNWQQVLVFTRTKHGANRLTVQLEGCGISAAAIHGNKSQGARTKALSGFKDGTIRVLVATDIAARGLDIDQLPHVVNFDLPNVPEDYVHRIGRTGRAGNSGEAVSLVCIDEHDLLANIEKLLKRRLDKIILPGYEVDPTIKAEPIINGRSRAPRHNGAQSSPRSAAAAGRGAHRPSAPYRVPR
jgi:ATP-dependent RNA helicase RhlE